MPRIDSHALVFEGGKNYVVVVEPDQRLQVKEVDVYKQLSKGVLYPLRAFRGGQSAE